MNNNPEITIITPTFNHRKFIKKCIDSVKKQTFTNWQMIIIDDHSTDGTYKIVKKATDGDPRIRVIRHAKNWGVKKLADTNNQALKLAKGKYIAILEGDDFWPTRKLEKQLDKIRNTSAVLSYGTCILTDETGVPIKLFSYDHRLSHLNNKPVGKILNLFTNLSFAIIPVTVVIRKRELLSIGGFKKDMFYPFTDIPTFLALTLKGQFSYQDDVLGFYRKQRNSEWFSFASKTEAMGRIEVGKCVNAFITKNNTKLKKLKAVGVKKINLRQNDYIVKKQRGRRLSLLLNSIAFNIKPSPLFVLFLVQYLIYVAKKNFR